MPKDKPADWEVPQADFSHNPESPGPLQSPSSLHQSLWTAGGGRNSKALQRQH